MKKYLRYTRLFALLENSYRYFIGALILTGVILQYGCSSMGAQPDAQATDMPDQGALGHTMNLHSEDFAYCGRDSVSIQTGSIQKIKLKFQVSPDGKADKIEVQNMSDPDPDLQVCLKRAVKKINFPKPKDGQAKPVLYPITLKSQ